MTKGQVGVEAKSKEGQNVLLERFDIMIQNQEEYYKKIQNMKNQCILNLPYREKELINLDKKNMTHLKKGYEMYGWEIFQSLKVSHGLFSQILLLDVMYFKDFVRQMKNIRIDKMTLFLTYFEAIVEDVKLDHLNYKEVALVLYNEFCEYLYFNHMRDCKPDFYKDIMTKGFDGVMQDLDRYFNKHNYSAELRSHKFSNMSILIEDKNDFHPIQSLKNHG